MESTRKIVGRRIRHFFFLIFGSFLALGTERVEGASVAFSGAEWGIPSQREWARMDAERTVVDVVIFTDSDPMKRLLNPENYALFTTGNQELLGHGIPTLTAAPTVRPIEMAREVGHFNLKRAFANFKVVSLTHHTLPVGAPWGEVTNIVNPLPLSLKSVAASEIFGEVEGAGDKESAQPSAIVGIGETIDEFTPETIAGRLGIAGNPEPTVLAILGLCFLLGVGAVLKVRFRKV